MKYTRFPGSTDSSSSEMVFVWETDAYKAGFIHGKLIKDEIILFVPPQQACHLADMGVAKRVTLSRLADDPTIYEFVFDDGSDAPFVLCLSEGAMDAIPDLLPKTFKFFIFAAAPGANPPIKQFGSGECHFSPF